MGKERNGFEEQSVERKVQEEVKVRVEEEQGESSRALLTSMSCSLVTEFKPQKDLEILKGFYLSYLNLQACLIEEQEFFYFVQMALLLNSRAERRK